MRIEEWKYIDKIERRVAALEQDSFVVQPPKGHVFYEGVLYQVLPGCRMREMPDSGGVRCQCTCRPYELWPAGDQRKGGANADTS